MQPRVQRWPLTARLKVWLSRWTPEALQALREALDSLSSTPTEDLQ